MKKLIFALLMLVSVAALADFGPVGRGPSLDGAGAINGPLEKWFTNVKNGSGGALLDGDVVIVDVSSDDGYTVTTSTTAGADPHCVLDEACADGAMCRCQTFGLKTNVNFDSTNANATAGDSVFISESNAGSVEGEVLGTIAITDKPIGIFYDDATASGDVEVFIKLK